MALIDSIDGKVYRVLTVVMYSSQLSNFLHFLYLALLFFIY